jgi:hypothetical protein
VIGITSAQFVDRAYAEDGDDPDPPKPTCSNTQCFGIGQAFECRPVESMLNCSTDITLLECETLDCYDEGTPAN